MTEQRVSLFVSHKVKFHQRAAKRIKEILQSRAERLDVYICEDNTAGRNWRDLVKEKLTDANVLLLLIPPNGSDISWIKSEILTFQAVHPNGWIVPFKRQTDKVPDFIKALQVVDSTKENFIKFLLVPLFKGDPDTGLKASLNPRITDTDFDRDGKEIEEIVRGLAPSKSRPYGEYLVVEVCGLDVTASLENAVVHAPDGCIEILNWQKKDFIWSELIQWANKEKGKGTFWVTEMADVIKMVCDGKYPPVMTSTFRGRGGQTVGLIFQPLLYNVDYVDENPVRFYFSFNQVLTPELVRGTGQIGDVFNALYTATRMRWEVIEPFYVKRISQLPTRVDEQRELIEHVINSFRVIDEYAERHKIIGDVYNVFETNDNENLNELVKFMKMRKTIKDELFKAAQKNNFGQFMNQLSKALSLNLRVTEILAEEYLTLVRKDHKKLRAFLKDYDVVEKSIDVQEARDLAQLGVRYEPQQL